MKVELSPKWNWTATLQYYIFNHLTLDCADRWLSGQLYRLDRHGHPHDLAIVAYALHITNMPAKVKK